MPKSTVVKLPEEEQAQILAALRRARYGYRLALHILLWCAAGRNPTEIAAVLFCSRSSVYRTVRAYQAEPSAGSTTPRGGSRLLRIPPYGFPPCDGRCWPCSRRLRERMGGAARVGAVQRWP